MYSGLVRAKSNCHIGGSRRSVGDVFEVVDYRLWSDCPIEPVHVVGHEDVIVPLPVPQRIVRVAIYERSNVPAEPASRRPVGDV